MGLGGVGKETVDISRRGWYETRAGARVSIAEAVTRAAAGTLLHRPGEFDRLELPSPGSAPTSIDVTPETTGAAVRRLVQREALSHVAALNFASAKNPGGGFLGNAKAQEEDLARCSALYHCQLTQPGYYEANRATRSMLYTDHLIYSPEVPFFRDEQLELLAEPFTVSLLTSPAPNAGQAHSRGEGHLVRETLERRAEHVLRVAAHHRHRTLVLGAWGCGVFRNEPRDVADVFGRLLAMPRFACAFERVVFAVYDRSEGEGTLRAFRERLGGPCSGEAVLQG